MSSMPIEKGKPDSFALFLARSNIIRFGLLKYLFLALTFAVSERLSLSLVLLCLSYSFFCSLLFL